MVSNNRKLKRYNIYSERLNKQLKDTVASLEKQRDNLDKNNYDLRQKINYLNDQVNNPQLDTQLIKENEKLRKKIDDLKKQLILKVPIELHYQ